MLKLALESLWNRRFFVMLSVLSIALSVALLCGVERLRVEAKASFANSASGVDMVIAARGNPVQILLSAVFGLGATGNGISWETFEHFEALPQTAWAVPIATGDLLAGFPVVGTRADYFEHIRVNGKDALRFDAGTVFADTQGAVIGAEVARRLGYGLGSAVVLAHGAGDVAFDVHDDAPFTVTGVLRQTGSAIDRMVFVSIEGFDALHQNGDEHSADPLADLPLETNRQVQGKGASEALPENGHAEVHHQAEHQGGGHDDDHDVDAPRQINAILIGLTDRLAVLSVQRSASTYAEEPVTAVIPNVALFELWALTGTAEAALTILSGAVVVVGILGMVVMIAASVEPRRREFAILRSVGATPAQIFALIQIEALIITLAGIVLGYGLLTALILIANPFLAPAFGLSISLGLNFPNEPLLILAVLGCSLVASLFPALRVYWTTLSDGLTIKM